MILDYHVPGEKKNLVTKVDKVGCYDERACINCGKTLKIYSLEVPRRVYGKCRVKPEREVAIRQQQASTVYGVWSLPRHNSRCAWCNSVLVKCPKEGHPNSQYLGLAKDDGCILKVCPNGCPEAGPLDESTKQRPVESDDVELLLAELKESTDQVEKRKLRSKLRKLGHKGGMKG